MLGVSENEASTSDSDIILSTEASPPFCFRVLGAVGMRCNALPCTFWGVGTGVGTTLLRRGGPEEKNEGRGVLL